MWELKYLKYIIKYKTLNILRMKQLFYEIKIKILKILMTHFKKLSFCSGDIDFRFWRVVNRQSIFFFQMKKLRVNANYTGAFIVENFKPSFQDIYLKFTGMKSLWWKQCISQRKTKKDTKSWKKFAVKENISGILKLFVTTQQFPSSAELQKPECRIITMRILLSFLQCKKAWWT